MVQLEAVRGPGEAEKVIGATGIKNEFNAYFARCFADLCFNTRAKRFSHVIRERAPPGRHPVARHGLGRDATNRQEMFE